MARPAPVIIDDDDPPPNRRSREVREPSREGSEWGLASTLIGATFLIIGPMSLLMFMALSRSNFDDYSGRGEGSRMEILSALAVLGAEVICITGLFFGMRGLSRSRSEKTTTALPATGILLSLAAIILWLAISVVVFSKTL